jgi:YidC/Oxa1 family membrane protein insertase
MNLGQPERLELSFIPFAIPVLTILVVISTYLQTKLTTPATADQQGAQMSQMMGLYMPLLLGYFAYTLASGLALYFVTSNLLGIVQGLIMRRVREANESSGGALPSTKKAKKSAELSTGSKKR